MSIFLGKSINPCQNKACENGYIVSQIHIVQRIFVNDELYIYVNKYGLSQESVWAIAPESRCLAKFFVSFERPLDTRVIT